MKSQPIIIPLLLSILLLTGCSATSTKSPFSQVQNTTTATDTETVKTTLYQQHQQWQGTRYQWGGLSKKGVDCSGLVHLTYLNKFNTPVPRTTKYQAQAGQKVQRSELRAGDLVFFKTSEKVRHVGIYIEDEKFLHASTKKGVMVSSLNDYYWKDKYWHARRVMF